jgi:2,4-dienoyl-CoA reductase-like NADH-dependent reductase (Old Yellow Enzyme family)
MSVFMDQLFEPLSFLRGKTMKNRFMLAPLTNSQSHEDGRLSDAELHWLTLRAQGGFGLVTTCASHVQAVGKGFPGQLGIFGDQHIDGLARLARAIGAASAVSIVQLYHAGNRAPKALIDTDAVCPSLDTKSGARALTTQEVGQVIEDFASASKRAELAGFDGVELHGAHGYLLCQFLSTKLNQRDDAYGGSLENRSRIFFSIIEAIRARCRADFIVGVRLSPERFGMQVREIHELAQRLIDTGKIDFLDLSLWDCDKEPEEPELKGRSLMSWFMDLDRKGVKLGVAGKLHDPADAARVRQSGADFVILGRAAILHHDYPNKLLADPAFIPHRPPVTRAYLRSEGLSAAFIDYMGTWSGFMVSDAAEQPAPTTDRA